MTVDVLGGHGVQATQPMELHEYLMAAAKIVETVSFEMASDHKPHAVMQLLAAAQEIELCAEKLKMGF